MIQIIQNSPRECLKTVTIPHISERKKNILEVFGVEQTVLVVLGVVSPAEPGTQSKVGQPDVTVLVDEDVVWFDVSVDEPHGVHGLNGKYELRDVELSQLVIKDSKLNEQTHQVASRNVVHHKVQTDAILNTFHTSRILA